MRGIRLGWLLAMAAAILAGGTAAAEPTPGEALRQARRVLVLGDSITYSGGWVAELAAWMEEQGLTASLVNAALASETVSGLSEEGHAGGRFPRPDLHERLERVLRLVRPDLVIACYGMNCGIYQPIDADRTAAFRRGIERLHEACERAGAKIIHLTPPIYDEHRRGSLAAAGYAAVLDAYSDWLLSKRADGWLVIDVHGPMQAAVAKRRKADPGFSFQPDGVHPDDAGHRVIAEAVLAGLDAAPESFTPAALAPFLPEVTERMRLLRDATLAAAGHSRPGVAAGLPLAEAEAKAAAITRSIRTRRLQLRGGHFGTPEWKMAIDWAAPPVVDPGPAPENPHAVPSDAVVLFDGTNLDAWEGGKWIVADGVATVRGGSIRSKQAFGDCQVHVEFRTPSPPKGKGQGRGNSGVFLMGLYEIQLLDSYQDGSDAPQTYHDGQCGALYKQQPPLVNACRPPGEWQSFDITFLRPRFAADGSLERPGRVSVLHNGLVIHASTEILGPTSWRDPPRYSRHPDALPLSLQDHRSPVEFRSIWIRPLEPLEPEELPRKRLGAN
jgi:lysophospholipase L1-like esterase